MKIVVCVKQVPDTATRIAITDGELDVSGSPRVMNPYDEFAVEESIKLRERFPDSEITALTLGPEKSRDVLKTALAMGADHAVHLLDPAFDALDTLGVAQALAAAIRGMEADLILCGRQAVDDDMAQVGPALGALLDIPFVTVVTQLEIADDQKTATITRQIEGGSEILEGELPLVLTCQKGLNEPRLPSLKGIMKAKKKEVTVKDASAIGFDPASAPRRVKAVNWSLPAARKTCQTLEGSPQEIAEQLVTVLREKEKLI